MSVKIKIVGMGSEIPIKKEDLLLKNCWIEESGAVPLTFFDKLDKDGRIIKKRANLVSSELNPVNITIGCKCEIIEAKTGKKYIVKMCNKCKEELKKQF